jgi:hypothetical protein
VFANHQQISSLDRLNISHFFHVVRNVCDLVIVTLVLQFCSLLLNLFGPELCIDINDSDSDFTAAKNKPYAIPPDPSDAPDPGSSDESRF